jgi:transposase
MLGIDVSKATLVCTLVTGEDRQVGWRGSVPNTPAGIDQLLATIPARVPWVVEPTGPYSQLVVRRAQGAARIVLQAPTRSAKAFLAAWRPRAKTDRVDSHGLALYAQAVPLRPYPRKQAHVEQVEQLLAARKGLSQHLASLRQQRATLPHAAVHLDAALAGLRAQLRALDAELAQLTADRERWPAVAALDAIPGVGPVTAAAVAACLQTRPFRHPDQFVAYVGLDVRVRDSGQHRGRRRLSRRGDAELRRLLYLCAQANLRVSDPDNPFKRQYERELAKGLPSTAALCAVARKLARTCWSLVTHGTTYDPARVHRQPPSVRRDPAAALDAQP